LNPVVKIASARVSQPCAKIFQKCLDKLSTTNGYSDQVTDNPKSFEVVQWGFFFSIA
jgi:hypothetical protein